MKTWVIFAALAVAVAIFALAADRLAAWFPDWLLLPLAGLAGILLVISFVLRWLLRRSEKSKQE